LEEERGRSLANARLLKEFEQMDWIQIDFEEIYNERRPYPNQKKNCERHRVKLSEGETLGGTSWPKNQPKK
jgi:hypothetical protein